MKLDKLTRRVLARLWKNPERPFPGPLAHQVLARLSDEVFRVDRSSLYVRIRAVERGRNPICEDFSIKFQLVASLPGPSPDGLILSDQPLGVTERVSSEGLPGGSRVTLPADQFFQFSGIWGLDENIRRFRRFAAGRIDHGPNPGDRDSPVIPVEALPLRSSAPASLKTNRGG